MMGDAFLAVACAVATGKQEAEARQQRASEQPGALAAEKDCGEPLNGRSWGTVAITPAVGSFSIIGKVAAPGTSPLLRDVSVTLDGDTGRTWMRPHPRRGRR